MRTSRRYILFLNEDRLTLITPCSIQHAEYLQDIAVTLVTLWDHRVSMVYIT
jgi:hypothetical protein